MKEMKNLHNTHSVNFESLKQKINDKKEAFVKNLKNMESKLKQHGHIFDSVKHLTDKLPELVDHFKNVIKNLSNRIKHHQEPVNTSSNTSSSETTSDTTSEQIVQNDHTVEEEAFGNESDKDDDNEEAESSESVHEDEGEEHSESEKKDKMSENTSEATSEGEVRDNEEKDDLSQAAGDMEGQIDEINDHDNLVTLDDGVLENLEEEQKGFEVNQNEQNEHINGLKFIDDGLVKNNNIRRNFGDRFVKFLDSKDMDEAPQDVKDHLHDLNHLFNAQEN
jgi:hypothetical protein